MNDLSKSWPFGISRKNALLFAFGFAVLIAALYFLDRPLSVWGTSLPQSVRDVFEWITQWGESDWILYPTLVAWLIAWLVSLVTKAGLRLALRELAAVSGFIFVSVGLTGLIATILKRIIGRGRPETWTLDVPLSFQMFSWSEYDYQSFPSGHAQTAFSLAAAITFLWPRAFWPMMVFAAAVAVSRIIVGAHYPTDITAGAILGLLGTYAVRAFFVSRGWLFEASEGRTSRRPFKAIVHLFKR